MHQVIDSDRNGCGGGGEVLIICMNVEPLFCVSETIIRLYINDTWTKKKCIKFGRSNTEILYDPGILLLDPYQKGMQRGVPRIVQKYK